jgi:cell division protein FtsB
MSLSHYNPHTRYKERAAQRMSALFGVLAIILLSALIGFWLGKQFAAQKFIVLTNENASLTEERDSLQKQVTELSASAQTANKRYEQLQEQVESIMPEGPMQDLVALVREQLDQGMNPERLSFVIRSARPPTGCVDPETKRFVVATPANKGAKSSVSIANGSIIITGSGVSARNEKNAAEAWYDPAKMVQLTIEHSGQVEQKQGILPLRRSIVVGGREYRFSVEAGARSFAKVTFDSCIYP